MSRRFNNVPMKKAAHPSGTTLLFNPQYHTYQLQGVGKCRSVSNVLNSYFPFNADKISTIMAKRRDVTKEVILEEWRLSAVLGSNVHALIEAELKGEPKPEFKEVQGSEASYEPVAKEATKNVLEHYDVIAIESMVACPKYKVAGTVDFLGRNKRTGGLFIGDWKTSASVKRDFALSQFDSHATGVLQHLPANKFMRYTLQTLVYGHIIRTNGYLATYDVDASVPIEYGLVRLGAGEFGDMQAVYRKVIPAEIEAPGVCAVEADRLLDLMLAKA